MSTSELMTLFSLLSPLVLVLGVITGLWFYNRLSPKYRWMLAYLGCALLIDILSRYWGLISSKQNNLVFLSVSGLIDLVFVAGLYNFYYLPKGQRWLLYPAAAIFLLVVCNLLFFGNLFSAANTFQSYDKLICNMVIVVYTLFCFMELLRHRRKEHREMMRINSSILVFFAVDILISMAANFLINESLTLVVYFWVLRLLLLTGMYLILIYTIWQSGKNPKHLQFG